jgi:putative DNA primase/helicase
MRGEWFDFRPEFKIWFGTNHRPQIRGTDEAIWDRIKLIPFEVRFPQRSKIKASKTSCWLRRRAFLAWAVDGCLAWQRDGLGEPEIIQEATKQYRSSEDVIGRFIDERCEMNDSASVTKKELYAAYRTWCDEGGEKPVTQKAFGSTHVGPRIGRGDVGRRAQAELACGSASAYSSRKRRKKMRMTCTRLYTFFQESE